MSIRSTAPRFLVALSALAVVACADSSNPVEPPMDASFTRGAGQDRLAEVFARVSPAVLSLGGAVFADHDETANKLVFGVANANAAGGMQRALAALGVAAADYEVRVTEPIYNMATLRDQFRPTQGGIQIHFGNYLCTMGFNVDHAGTRSFITNSHCTNRQGGTEGTVYYQPVSTTAPASIAIEVDDPDYFTGGSCPAGRKCRYSDAARALYNSGTASSQGLIAKTTGANNGSLTVSGAFSVTAQSNATSFSGTVNKVGRTTGWTSGTVISTCADVNVWGSNVTQLCQTRVWRPGSVIVGGGDSGSPVFMTTGGDNVTLAGILWGGSGSGDEFVFSPLKNIQDELGAFAATTSGGGGVEPPPPPPEEPPEEPPCQPKGKNGKNCK